MCNLVRRYIVNASIIQDDYLCVTNYHHDAELNLDSMSEIIRFLKPITF
jgi:hypothetical protein